MNKLNDWINIFEAHLADHSSADGAHDIYHLRRVWALAQRFCAPEDDHLVILAACYLHDIISHPKDSIKRSHSSKDASQRARDFMILCDYPAEKIDHVCHCIEAHSFSANIKPQTREAQIVQDADRIEALGAIGIARTFYTAGLMKSKLFCSEDPFAKNRDLDDKKYAIDHFTTKLLNLPAQMNTAAGREEAHKRAQVLQSFLQNLESEL